MAVSDWSTTPGNNSTVGGADISEGCSPAGINDAIRNVMAEARAEFDLLPRLAGDETVSGDWTVSGSWVVSGAWTVAGNWVVSGDWTFSGDQTFTGQVTVTDTSPQVIITDSDNGNIVQLRATDNRGVFAVDNAGAIASSSLVFEIDGVDFVIADGLVFNINGTLNADAVAGDILATQAEAEAGTATNKVMNPLRTAQAIAELAESPVKAWANFAGASGAIAASSGVTSVVRNSAGNYTVTLSTALTDANYAVTVSLGFGSTLTNGENNVNPFIDITSATQFDLFCIDSNSDFYADPTVVTFTVVR